MVKECQVVWKECINNIENIKVNSKLKGFKKLIVKAVGKTISKENTELVNLFQNGGNYVKKENLEELIKYVKTQINSQSMDE